MSAMGATTSASDTQKRAAAALEISTLGPISEEFDLRSGAPCRSGAVPPQNQNSQIDPDACPLAAQSPARRPPGASRRAPRASRRPPRVSPAVAAAPRRPAAHSTKGDEAVAAPAAAAVCGGGVRKESTFQRGATTGDDIENEVSPRSARRGISTTPLVAVAPSVTVAARRRRPHVPRQALGGVVGGGGVGPEQVGERAVRGQFSAPWCLRRPSKRRARLQPRTSAFSVTREALPDASYEPRARKDQRRAPPP
mmetsp:Transcript_3073/g.10158  ORF Transcript_3073/g.10158 Transcript_3073/m.10158 type:complete len:253 (-) Transcript_3073:101-859(-)